MNIIKSTVIVFAINKKIFLQPPVICCLYKKILEFFGFYEILFSSEEPKRAACMSFIDDIAIASVDVLFIVRLQNP